MIIWLNGAFGSGKTSVAEVICKKLRAAHLYDPEQVGYFLWNSFPEEMRGKGNFQHIPIWRELNQKILHYINRNYRGTIVVPMTIYKKQYYDEIIGKLSKEKVEIRHFILSAQKQTIINRLKQRGESENSWAAQHIDKCIKAFQNEICGEIIDTESKSVEEIASLIITKSNCVKEWPTFERNKDSFLKFPME